MYKLFNIQEGLSIAIHVCLWVAADNTTYHPSADVAQKLGFSYHHFAKIIQRLVKTGILQTERGPKGGIRLARPTAKITLLDLYLATGGQPLHPQHRCLLDPAICAGCACGLGRWIRDENTRLHNRLQTTTLASLARTFDKTQIKSA